MPNRTFVSNPQAPVVGSLDRYKWEVLLVVMIGTMMAALDTSIVNIAMPNIMSDFGSTIDDIEWVATGYMMAYAVFIPMSAWIRERMGSRNLYLAAIALFTVGSVLCGFAWNLPSLIVARILQAVGGGAVTPTGMTMVSEVFEPHERGKAMGFWGMGVIIGPALGPTLGGYLTQTVGWRSIFFVNVPLGILVLLLGGALLRREAAHPVKKAFDLWGFLFLSAFLAGFLLGISKGEEDGWGSAFIVGCFLCSTAGLVGFLLVESLVPHGIVDLSLFENRIFSSCVVVTIGRSIAMFAAMFLMPLFSQNLMGLDAFQSGLLLLPGSVLLAACMPVAGKLSDRFGPRYLVLAGTLGIAYFMYLYRALDANSSLWDFVWPTFIRAGAISLMVAPIMATALNAIPLSKSAQASAILNLIQQVGGSAGIAVLGTVLDNRQAFQMAHLATELRPASPVFARAMGHLTWRALDLGYSPAQAHGLAQAALARLVGLASAVRGFDDTFWFGAVIILVTGVPVLLLPSKRVVHSKAFDAAAME